jgi:hypothetical protein
MIDDGRVLWTHSEDDSAKGGQLTFPFSFTVGNSERRLPPSFDCGHSWQGGRVQYFIHLVAVRKSWYQRNVRINSAFPFLPADHSTAAQTDFAEWKGPWSTHSESFKVRSNVFQFFAAAAFVDVQVHSDPPIVPSAHPIPKAQVARGRCVANLSPHSSPTRHHLSIKTLASVKLRRPVQIPVPSPSKLCRCDARARQDCDCPGRREEACRDNIFASIPCARGKGNQRDIETFVAA